jgi:Txe/YoeB family toxin of toxin-antitoxin system
MGYKLIYAQEADKDARKLERAGLMEATIKLLAIIRRNPYQKKPPYEKLKGNYKGSYSRRINRQHRLIYDVLPNVDSLKDESGVLYKGIIKVVRMWTHYE